MNRRLNDKQQKKLADDARLLRAWKKFHREEREAALAAHGAELGELFRMLENLQHVQPAQLIGFVHSIAWALIPYDVKLTVLHEINVAITKFREKRGAEPIDDNLPGQPDTPYRVIHRIIHQIPHGKDVAPAEAQLGPSINPSVK